MAGAAHIVLRRGRCVFSCAEGWSDIRGRVRFGLGTICKLHGCTKPLVIAAFLTLVERGRVRLADPVRKYIPFPDRVAPGPGGRPGPARRPATLRNLMTMTAGLGYEDCGRYRPAMRKVARGRITSLAGLCDSLASVPLVAQPGTCYHYSFATDMLGRVCEAVSGQPLDEFVDRSVLGPLGMKDTHFIVPPRKSRRVAVLYDAKPLKRKASSGGARFALRPWSDATKSPPGIMSAGGGIISYEDPGMMSTARDYAHFCQMLLNGGVAPNGRRILKAATVKTLWGDALAAYSGADGRLRGWNDAGGDAGGFWDYTGCSLLHTHLVFDEGPSRSKRPRRATSMWMGGGGGASWVVDAKRDLVSVTFTQGFGGRADPSTDGLGPSAYDAYPFAAAAADGARGA